MSFVHGDEGCSESPSLSYIKNWDFVFLSYTQHYSGHTSWWHREKHILVLNTRPLGMFDLKIQLNFLRAAQVRLILLVLSRSWLFLRYRALEYNIRPLFPDEFYSPDRYVMVINFVIYVLGFWKKCWIPGKTHLSVSSLLRPQTTRDLSFYVDYKF